MTRGTRAWLLAPWAVRMTVPAAVPGVYLLGDASPASSAFNPTDVGRSDTDLRRRLLAHAQAGKAAYFRCRPCGTQKEAFQRECVYWHSLRGSPLRNKAHPDAPDGCALECPYCSAARMFAAYIAGHS